MADREKDFPCGDGSTRPGIGCGDHPRGTPEGVDDRLAACYTLLQISPGASLEEISAAYHNLKETWREDRFDRVDTWPEKAKTKQAEIDNAYDTILKTRLHELTGHRQEPELIRDDPSPVLLPEEEILLDEEEDEEEGPTFLDNLRDRFRSRRLTVSRRAGQVLAAALLILMMVAGGLFIWPALHRPAPSEPSGGTPPVTAPAPLPDAIQGLPIETVPQGSIAAAIPLPAGPEKETPRDLAAQKHSGGVAPSGSLTAPKSSAGTQKELKTKPSRSAAKDKSLPRGPYSIQIKAFREEAKARAFLGDLKTRYAGAHLQKATVAGQGNWYRVLIGHYETRDQALADLKKRIAESYPGSFVQKTGKGDRRR